MLPLNKKRIRINVQRAVLALSLLAWIPFAPPLAAQTLKSGNPAAHQGKKPGGQFKIDVNVSLVVLHATVVNRKGNMVNGLTRKDFQVLEDGQPQQMAVFSHADIPVTMGIDIDDSGSMRDKRPSVNAAALTFVRTSNPDDQVFVVNFNDVYYLDTPGNFASNMQQLKAALSKIDSRGGTALYDAVYASLDHLKLGNRDKKVLLVITDGEDNASRYSFTELLRYAQKSNAAIYCIGLLGQDHPGGLFRLRGGEARRAAKVLKELAQATGGKAFFPKTLADVEPLCASIANDIRNQYTLGYYPTNARKDGTFRRVEVKLVGQAAHHHYEVRTRPGYYAPKSQGGQPAASGG